MWFNNCIRVPAKLFIFQIGPFLTAVPDGEFAPSDGCSMPALHKLRTQVSLYLWLLRY